MAILINLLVVVLVVLLSMLFYIQFRKALNDRVLLQLSSIKQLKRVQIIDYLEQQQLQLENIVIEDSISLGLTFDSLHDVYFDQKEGSVIPTPEMIKVARALPDGIHDLSGIRDDMGMLLAFKRTDDDERVILRFTEADKVQQILLERTGMGETGETYLVGSDTTLRSLSRFFPEEVSTNLHASTEGVLAAMQNLESTGIFRDYRGVRVFSAYGPLEIGGLDWSILSEMDQEEAMIPLNMLRHRLLMIALLVIIIMSFISFYLAARVVKPLERMKSYLNEMSLGNFNIQFEKTKGGDEIEAIFEALDKLVLSVNQAMKFAYDVGQLRFDQAYKPLSDQDTLGKSLLQMRDKLKAFNEQEELHQLQRQKALLVGQEKERARLSKELHDGLGPLLTSLKLYVQRLEISNDDKGSMKELLDETIKEVRRMSYNLMPQTLMDFGVGQAVDRLVQLVREASKQEIKYVNSMNPDNQLSTELNIGIYRIAQEVLNNAIKHADAQEIRMSLTEFDDHVSLFFQDNGNGFDINKTYSGAGLLNIRERCRVLNGQIEIYSDDAGTQIEVEIPLSDDKDSDSGRS